MKVIEENKYYKVSVDVSKNRIYIDVKGFWPSIKAVPIFIDRVKESIAMVKRSFTMVVDARTMVTAPAEVNNIHKTVQELVTAAGLFQAAEIVPQDVIAKLQTDALAKNTSIPKGMFVTVEEGEKWLKEELQAVNL